MPESATALIEVIESLVSDALHAEASRICAGKGWYFGNRSNEAHDIPFWKMDLDGVPVFDAIWEAARPICEELAGRKLRVVRQYANGHTYGLGGQPHLDDERPGTYTLLYYPMMEWQRSWQGETVFHDDTGEIAVAVTPLPNRAVFFDAQIPHAGRAPARSCPALRVTVAYKLEAVEGLPEPAAPAASAPAETTTPTLGLAASEQERNGAHRVYRIDLPASLVTRLTEERLTELGQSLRMPGFRKGHIPMEVLQSRYRSRARGEVLGRLGEQAVTQLLATGGMPASLRLLNGAESGDAAFSLAVTHLPDLPEPDATQWKVERLVADNAATTALGLDPAATTALLTQHLHQQVLDHLHQAVAFPVAPQLIEHELRSIQQVMQLEEHHGEAHAAVLGEMREIAERRVRLGAVMLELARRHGLVGPSQNVEQRVLQWLLAQVQISERAVTLEELRQLVE